MADASKTHRILVVDDESAARSGLAELLKDEGYDVRSAADGFKALGRVEDWEPDVVVTDVRMPGMDGITLMKKLRDRLPDISVLVMTAFGSVEHAVEAMQLGADDYLTKPVQLPELLIVLKRVIEHRDLKREAERLRRALLVKPTADSSEFVGQSRPFRALMDLAARVADSNAAVLIEGETGAGKYMVARHLHDSSERKNGTFLHVHCSGITDAELDSQLEQARGLSDPSTLFLDEVGELSDAGQAKLLAFLRDHETGDEPLLRLIASTHHELGEQVQNQRFREDLYYALNVITLRTPTLRERRDDIAHLAVHFVRKYARDNSKTVTGLSDRALGVLLKFDWPGNVRQLQSCIERAVVVCDQTRIEPRHLPREVMHANTRGEEMPLVPGSSLRELEKFAILRTLEHVGGSTTKAAEILGISPRKIQYRLNEYQAEKSEQTKSTRARGGSKNDTPQHASA